MTLYRIREGSTLEQRCVIFAAASAAKTMEYGDYTEEGASGDREDIRKAGGDQDYDVLVKKANKILIARRTNFQRVASLLRTRILRSNDIRPMTDLPDGRIGAFIVYGHEL